MLMRTVSAQTSCLGSRQRVTALHPERGTQAERLPLCLELTPLFPHWPVAPTQAPERRTALDKALLRNWLKPATILYRTAQSVSNNFLVTGYLMDDDLFPAAVS
jgi:hypothetical protein